MKHRKSNTGKVIFILLIVVIAALGAFVYVSPQFEKNKPIVQFQDNIYWNLKDKLKITFSDDSGIKYYKIIFKDRNSEKVLKQEVLTSVKNEIQLELEAPKFDMFFKSKQASIIVEVIDNSKWNFFEGNKTFNTYNINIDKKRPNVDVVSHSYAVRKGGSAVVVTKIEDENLKDAYISFGNDLRFELIPFYKENYYMTIIGWPVTMDDFSGVNVVAIDKANNFSKMKIPLYIRSLKVKKSRIKISNSFIKNVSTKVIEQSSQDIPEGLNNIFVKQNRLIRSENIKKIMSVSQQYMNKDLVTDFTIDPFRRLTNSKTAGYFGQKRYYYHDGEQIDEAWHLGMDWASVKRADIQTSNDGTVIFNDYLGIYGNTIIVDHGFGIQTLYAHTSSSNVNVGESVSKKQKIANTGTTGAVLGDHLHFGVLVQGIEVNPLEWMDKNWIKTRITDILDDAKKVIDNK